MTSSKVLALISDKMQYDTFVKQHKDVDVVTILCDNADFYDFLQKEKIDFVPIEQKVIQGKWHDITFWACEKSIFSEGDPIPKTLFGGIDTRYAFYPWFSYYISTILTSYFFAKYILDTYKPKKVFIFNNIKNALFPRFDTNYFLNLFIRDLSKEESIEQEYIVLGSGSKCSVSAALRHITRTALATLNAMFTFWIKNKHSILIHGNLSHLSDVALELKSQGNGIVVFDSEFQMKSYGFCKESKISYITADTLLPIKSISSTINEYSVEFRNFLDGLAKNKWFTYKGINFSDIITKEILKVSNKYIAEISKNSIFYSYIIKKYGIEKVVISEDIIPYGSHRASFFKSKDIKVYCLSHGIPTPRPNIPNFNLNDLKKNSYISETIVQSEYEKELYVKYARNKEHIHVKGLPRYDRLVEIKRKMSSDAPKGEKMNLLYCPSGMFEDIRRMQLHPGEQYTTTSHHSKNCFIALIDAVAGLNVHLVIKPHFISDLDLWKSYIDKYKKDVEVELASASEDFFNLLPKSNLMVTGYSSTAIIESAILDIPTIMIYYPDPSYICPLSSKGLAIGVRSQDQLNATIKEIYQSFIDRKKYHYLTKPKVELEFLIGPNDGQNIKRILDYINTGN